MIITLCKSTSEKNRMYKDDYLSDSMNMSCTLKTPVSFLNPIVQLYSPTDIYRHQYNYAYISDFNRYYFVTDIISLANNMWEIHMHVDVLMSWKEKIVTNKALIVRSSDKGNSLLTDNLNSILPKWEFYYGDSLNIFDIEEVDYNTHKSNRNILLFVRNNTLDVRGTYSTIRTTNLQEPATPCATPFFGGKIYIVDELYLTLIVANNGNNSNIMSSIIKAIAFPFDLVKFYNKINTGFLQTEKGIHLTNYESGEEIVEVEDQDIYYIPNFATALLSYDLEQYIPKEAFYTDTYLDFEPFSYYKLHLPMFGDIDINAEDFNYNNITLKLVFDPWNGTMTYSIYVIRFEDGAYGSEKCVLTKQAMIGSQIIISFDNADLASKDYNVNLTSDIVQSLTSGASLVTGLALLASGAGAPLGAGLILAGAGGMTKSLSGMISRQVNLKGASSGASGSNTGIFNTFVDCGLYFYKIFYKTTYQYNDDNYVSIVGRPANTVVTISECHGYLEVGTCHLDNVNALSDELDEITQLLQQGILMPDN